MLDYNSLFSEFFIIAGPCVIESKEICEEVCETILETCNDLKIPYIFKSSFDKANRSSISSFRGPGLEKGIKILEQIKVKFNVPILTDVHETNQINQIKDIVDIIQIPAFLCRQTDLLVEAGNTDKIINVKKGQFLAPLDVKNIIEKIKTTGNNKILITERGTSFGYNNLVVDMRSFPIIKSMGVPVVFDATHSVQLPGGQGTCSGGNREFALPLSRAAIAAGANGIFMEVHPEPDKALCDGPNSLHLQDIRNILKELSELYRLVNKIG